VGGLLRQSLHILLDAFYRFNRGDGWAIASHIALSILMSVFPFLILVTAIAGFIGSVDLANEVTRLLFATWPQEVAGPLATEIHHVLTTSHSGLVTISAVFAVYFSSSGIESLRIGLNRAYGLRERRSFWVLRLESISFVLLSAIALLVVAFLIVLGPLLFKVDAAAKEARSARWSGFHVATWFPCLDDIDLLVFHKEVLTLGDFEPARGVLSGHDVAVSESTFRCFKRLPVFR
jgi:membrane protein